MTSAARARPATTARATAAPRPAVTPRPPRTPLTVVPVPRTRPPRAPFIAVIALLMVGGLLGLLALNTMLAQDAFAAHELQTQSKALADREQELLEQVEAMQAPAALAAEAQALGMVPGGTPVFLDLAGKRVLGDVTDQPDAIPVVPTAPVPPAPSAPAAPTTPTAPTVGAR